MTNLIQYREQVNIVMPVAYGPETSTPYPDGSIVTKRQIIGRDEQGQYWRFENTCIRQNYGIDTTLSHRGFFKVETLPERNNPHWWFNPHWSE